MLEHRALTTHNDSRSHWEGNHGAPEAGVRRIKSALAEYERADGGYIDVHAWYFTPQSLSNILSALRETGYIGLEVERLYPTRRFSNEFWIILRRT